jgi:hypothetical protein
LYFKSFLTANCRFDKAPTHCEELAMKSQHQASPMAENTSKSELRNTWETAAPGWAKREQAFSAGLSGDAQGSGGRSARVAARRALRRVGLYDARQ